MSALIPAVVIGGVTYTLVKANDAAPVNGGATGYQTSFGNTIGQQLGGIKTAPPPPTGTVRVSGSLGSKIRMVNATISSPLTPKTNWNYADQHNNIDPEYAQKLAELEKYAEEQFNNMDEVGRAKAADILNEELKLDPPLNGHEDWKTIASVAGGAAGAALGTAACGPICGKVGALVGAYLGVKLEEAIAKNFDEMKAWLRDKWGDLKDQAEETWDDIKDAAGDAWDTINPF